MLATGLGLTCLTRRLPDGEFQPGGGSYSQPHYLRPSWLGRRALIVVPSAKLLTLRSEYCGTLSAFRSILSFCKDGILEICFVAAVQAEKPVVVPEDRRLGQ